MGAESVLSAANEAMARVVKALLKETGPDRAVTSVEALSAATGIPYGTLRKRMDARVPFDYEQLILVAAALGTPLGEMLRRAEAIRLTLLGPPVTATDDFDPLSREAPNLGNAPATGSDDAQDTPGSTAQPDLEARYLRLQAELAEFEKRLAPPEDRGVSGCL